MGSSESHQKQGCTILSSLLMDLGARSAPVTAVEWSADGNFIFAGGVDNEIKCWDLRKKEVVYTLRGHADTVSVDC